MHRSLVSLASRCALAVALALALALTGCGRKGALDPPPGGLTDATHPPPAQATATAVAPDGQPVPAPAPQPAENPRNRRLPILDWLLD